MLPPTLNFLCRSRVPITQTLAYLDDNYLFSHVPQVRSKTTALLHKQHIIKLKERECKLVSFEENKCDGFKLLGTMVGGKEGREEVFRGGDPGIEKIDKLKDVPHQCDFLLLRFCVDTTSPTKPEVERLRTVWENWTPRY